MTEFGRNISLQEDLEIRFGDLLDQEGPFRAEKDDIEHFDRQYDRLSVGEFLGADIDVGGQVYRDSENEEAAYFSTFNELGDAYFVDLDTDGPLDMVYGSLRDRFV